MFVTGAVVLAVEILGTRILAPFYGTTIYVWTSLISVTMGSLALGYFIGGKIVDKHPLPIVLFSVNIIAAFLVILPVKIDQYVLPATNSFGIQYGPMAAALLLFFAPLFVLGMTSPMVMRLVSKEVREVGSVAGRVFSLGTIGSIVGALLAGFFLLPLLSVSHLFYLFSSIIFLVSIIGLLAYRPHTIKTVGNVVILILFLLGTINIPKTLYIEENGTKILHSLSGHYGDLKVVEVAGIRCVTNGGVTESCTEGEEKNQSNFFKKIADMIEETGAKNILVLGTGGGNLAASLTENIKADLVDIDPGIIKLGKDYLGFQAGTNQQVYVDDARHFLATSDKKYDLIYVDLFKGVQPPYHVFSKEAFELMKSKLSDDGVVMVYFLGGIGERDTSVASVVETAKTVFPSVIPITNNPGENAAFVVYLSPDPGYTVKLTESHFTLFIPADLDLALGKVLVDDKNPLDLMFAEKGKVLLQATRNFVGTSTLFSI